MIPRLLRAIMSSCCTVILPCTRSWRAEHGEPPTEAAVWDLYRLEQKSVAASTQTLERAEAETSGEAPIPPSMVTTTDWL